MANEPPRRTIGARTPLKSPSTPKFLKTRSASFLAGRKFGVGPPGSVILSVLFTPFLPLFLNSAICTESVPAPRRARAVRRRACGIKKKGVQNTKDNWCPLKFGTHRASYWETLISTVQLDRDFLAPNVDLSIPFDARRFVAGMTKNMSFLPCHGGGGFRHRWGLLFSLQSP